MMQDDSNSSPHKGACCGPASPPNAQPLEEAQAAATIQIVAGEASHQDIICHIAGGASYLGTDSALIPVDEEGPLRASKISSFYMDAYAVTVQRFAQFVSETGYQTEAERLGTSFVFAGFLPEELQHETAGQAVHAAPWWRLINGASWHKPAGPEAGLYAAADHPVTHISWHDAAAFAAWAGGRLPTEAEWEHAARAGQGDVRFPWGDKEPDDDSYQPCNIWQGRFPNDNTARDGFAGTAPVWAFEPNAYGLYQMMGNVWEWTSSPFKVRSLKKAVKQAHHGKAGFKIVKGGSFLCHQSYCYRYRIAARTANSPDSATAHTGFRLAYDELPTS